MSAGPKAGRGYIWWLTIGFAFILLGLTWYLALDERSDRTPRIRARISEGGGFALIYDEPDLLSGIAGTIDRGATVLVYDAEDDENPVWFFIRTTGKEGWIQKRFLVLDEP
jgi:hypothetical protein